MLSLYPPANYGREKSLGELCPLVEEMLSPEGFFAVFERIFAIIHAHDGTAHNWTATPKNEIGWMGNISGRVTVITIKLYVDGRPGKNALILTGRFLDNYAVKVDSYAITVSEDTVVCQDLRFANSDHTGYDSAHSVDVIVQLLLQLQDAK